MAYSIIPLTTDPSQSFQCTIPIDGKNITLTFLIRYNDIAKYWTMGISDASGNLLIDSLPLVTGEYPAANILAQYAYLGIGSAVVLNIGNLPADRPDDTNLGADYYLVWGDTVV